MPAHSAGQPGMPPPGQGQPRMPPPGQGQPGMPPPGQVHPGMLPPGQYPGYPYGQPHYSRSKFNAYVNTLIEASLASVRRAFQWAWAPAVTASFCPPAQCGPTEHEKYVGSAVSGYAMGETAPRVVAPVKSQLSKAALLAMTWGVSPTCAFLDRAVASWNPAVHWTWVTPAAEGAGEEVGWGWVLWSSAPATAPPHAPAATGAVEQSTPLSAERSLYSGGHTREAALPCTGCVPALPMYAVIVPPRHIAWDPPAMTPSTWARG